MPIPASQIVQVNVGLIPPGGNNLEFNGLILTKNPNLPVGTVYQFADTAGVYDYFGFESSEATLAEVYFLGYDNSFKKPIKLLFSRFADTAQNAWVRGAKVLQTVEELKLITSGNLTIIMNGYEANLTGIDFSPILTYSDVATIFQQALREETAGGEAFTACTVEFSSLFNAFIITNGSTGDQSTITSITSDIATALQLTEEQGAIYSPGTDPLSYTETMEGIIETDANWVNFMTAYMPAEEDVLGFADWSSGKGVDFMFLYGDNSPTLLIPNSTATIAEALKEGNYSAVAGCWNSQEYAAFIMGIAASIDWNRRNGLPTTAFKSQTGLPANVESGTNALNLEAQNMNFMGDYATRNDNFVFNFPGRIFGDFQFIDTYWAAVWIKNQIQVACLNGLKNAPRVPYNETGYTLIRAWIMDPIIRGLFNGVISSGVVLSESQKAQITYEVGEDVSTQIYVDGYYLKIEDPGPNARLNRESPNIYFYFTYAGSVHRLVIPVRILT